MLPNDVSMAALHAALALGDQRCQSISWLWTPPPALLHQKIVTSRGPERGRSGARPRKPPPPREIGVVGKKRAHGEAALDALAVRRRELARAVREAVRELAAVALARASPEVAAALTLPIHVVSGVALPPRPLRHAPARHRPPVEEALVPLTGLPHVGPLPVKPVVAERALVAVAAREGERARPVELAGPERPAVRVARDLEHALAVELIGAEGALVDRARRCEDPAAARRVILPVAVQRRATRKRVGAPALALAIDGPAVVGVARGPLVGGVAPVLASQLRGRGAQRELGRRQLRRWRRCRGRRGQPRRPRFRRRQPRLKRRNLGDVPRRKHDAMCCRFAAAVRGPLQPQLDGVELVSN